MFKSRKNQCSYIIFLALFLFFNPILVLAQTGSVTFHEECYIKAIF